MVGLECPKLSPNVKEPFPYPTLFSGFHQTSLFLQIIVNGTVSMSMESWRLLIKMVGYQTKD